MLSVGRSLTGTSFERSPWAEGALAAEPKSVLMVVFAEQRLIE